MPINRRGCIYDDKNTKAKPKRRTNQGSPIISFATKEQIRRVKRYPKTVRIMRRMFWYRDWLDLLLLKNDAPLMSKPLISRPLASKPLASRPLASTLPNRLDVSNDSANPCTLSPRAS